MVSLLILSGYCNGNSGGEVAPQGGSSLYDVCHRRANVSLQRISDTFGKSVKLTAQSSLRPQPVSSGGFAALRQPGGRSLKLHVLYYCTTALRPVGGAGGLSPEVG
jgi:hypothetical protein